MLSRVPTNALRSVVRPSYQIRCSSGIKLLNERAKAEEDYYFTKQDGMIPHQYLFPHIFHRKAD